MLDTRTTDQKKKSVKKRNCFVAAIALLCGMYAYGLTRDINEPWVGWHDWNGAFFSQLARNFLRYPFDVHRGMPIDDPTY